MTARAKSVIAAGEMPLRASHDSPDGPDGIVGRIVALDLSEDGLSAVATAEILPTRAGRDAMVLMAGPQPVLAWSLEADPIGPISRESGPNGVIDVFGDLALTGVAMTGWPGISTARPRMERHRRPGTIVEAAPGRPHPLAVEAAGMTSSELRRFAADAYLSSQPVPAAAVASDVQLSPGELMAAEIRADHAALMDRQRAEWLARDTR